MAGHFGVTGGDLELGSREKHRHETARHQVIQFLFRLRQILRRLRGRDDRKVIADLGIVEDPLVRLDPTLVQDLRGELLVVIVLGDRFQRLLDGAQVIFRQMARIGTRVGQHLVLFVQCLCQAQRVLGGEAETRVGFALQAGQVEQRRRHRGSRLRFFTHRAHLAAASSHDRFGGSLAPQTLGALFRIVLILLVRGIEPAAFVDAGGADEFGAHFPEIARHEFLDLLFTLDHDRQGRRLHTADGGQIETAFFRIEGGHCARAVDADQPVRFAATAGGIGQRQHVLVFAQMGEAVADRARRHRLQPQAFDRLLGFRILRNQAENQLAFAPGVTCVDQGRDILALDQLVEHLEARLGLGDRIERKVRRNHRQMGEGPFAALDIVFFRNRDFQQVADRGGQDVFVGFKVLIVLGEAAERLRDIVRDRRFLSNDEGLAHSVVSKVARIISAHYFAFARNGLIVLKAASEA